MTSSLTSALEILDQAISKLETAIDSRVTQLETQQQDLFSQLDVERDRTKSIARELDTVISQIEKTLQTNPSTVN
jgi:hypothetical protein